MNEQSIFEYFKNRSKMKKRTKLGSEQKRTEHNGINGIRVIPNPYNTNCISP